MVRQVHKLQDQELQRVVTQRLVAAHDCSHAVELLSLILDDAEKLEDRLRQHRGHCGFGGESSPSRDELEREDHTVWNSWNHEDDHYEDQSASSSFNMQSMTWLTELPERWLREDAALRNELDDVRKSHMHAVSDLRDVLSRRHEFSTEHDHGNYSAASAAV